MRTYPTWAALPLRIALGAVFIAHGAQKVFGIWGGRGLGAFASGDAPLNLRPSWLWLSAAALAEFIGGILVLLGLLTRLGAFLIACVMLVAVFGVHLSGGFFLRNNGVEFALTLLLVALSLVVMGGGNASLDQKLAR
jgi:putative oxidoreductase